MRNWIETSLGREIDLKTGFPFKSSEYSTSEDDVRLLRGDNIVQGAIRWDDAARWPKTRAHDFDEYYLAEGDVVLAMDRPWIEAGLKQARISSDDIPCLQVQRTARLRGGPRLETSYLRYIISGAPFTNYVKLVNTGSNVPHISSKQIKDFKISLPPLNTQQKIAKVLSTLDAKIELNNRINAELEAMAKLLYDYWFVQFDFPMSAEQAAAIGKPECQGQPYKSSGGKMVFNPILKREIPEGWEVGNLLGIANYINGIACQKYRPTSDESLPVIKIREMRDGFTKSTERVGTHIPDKVKVSDGDVLFSWSASLEVMIWTGGEGGLNQHIFKVTSKKFPRSYFYHQLSDYLAHFKMIADLRKTTMGHITQDHLNQSRISIPPTECTSAFDAQVGPIQEASINHQKQNQELTTLRDWLLPMLMNGQVSVKESP